MLDTTKPYTAIQAAWEAFTRDGDVDPFLELVVAYGRDEANRLAQIYVFSQDASPSPKAVLRHHDLIDTAWDRM